MAKPIKIKVVIEDGIIDKVLSDGPYDAVEVEIVEIDRNYTDCVQLREYRNELCKNNAFKHANYTIARMNAESK